MAGRRTLSNIISKWAHGHNRKFTFDGRERVDALVELFQNFIAEGYDHITVKQNATKKLVMERITAPSKKGSRATSTWKLLAERDYKDAYDEVFDPREGDEIGTDYGNVQDEVQDAEEILEKIEKEETSDISNENVDPTITPEWLKKIQEQGEDSRDAQSDDDFMEDLGLK